MSTEKLPGTVSPIEDILRDYLQGQMVILVDDEDRENEGDLIVAAGFVTRSISTLWRDKAVD